MSEEQAAALNAPSRPLPLGLRALLFGAAYLVAAAAGGALSPAPGPFVTFWLPSGVYLGTLLIHQPSQWPALVLAAGVANLGFDLANGRALPVSLLFFCGNSLEALVGAWLLRRVAGGRPDLSRLRDASGLALLCAGLSTTLGASFGASVVWATGSADPFWVTWRLWWSGDLVGVLLAAPVILTWVPAADWPWSGAPFRGRIEAAATLVGIAALAALVFDRTWQAGFAAESLALPLVVWVALRFSPRGVAAATLVIGLVAGRFAGVSAGLHLGAASPPVPTASLQILLAAIACVGLVMTAALAERRRASGLVRLQRDVATHLAEAGDLEPGLKAVLAACGTAGFDCGAIYLRDAGTGALELRATRGLSAAFADQARRLDAGSPQHQALLDGSARYWESADAAGDLDPIQGARAVAIVPLRHEGRLGGAVYLGSRRSATVGPDNRAGVEAIAAQVGATLARLAAEAAAREGRQRLRASEERFRATFEQAPVGIAHVAPDGRWLRVNQRLCQIVGFTRDELLRTRFQDITHPEDLEADLALTQRLLEGRIAGFSMEKRYLCKQPSEVWVQLTVSLVRGESGQPEYFIAVVEDLSDRRRVEVEALEWKRRYEVVEAASGEAIYDWDLASGRVHWSENAGSVLGCPRAELGQGLGWLLERIDVADREAVLLKLEEAPRLTGPFEIECGFRRGDGRVRRLRVTGISTAAGPDPSRRLIGVIEDVTERRRAETLADLGALTAGVAHEVRNPLFAISANVEALEAVLRDRVEVADMVEATRREVERLSALMTELMEYGRPSTASAIGVPLCEVLEAALGTCRSRAGRAGVSLASRVASGPWRLRMDRERMARVFENLIQNAIQHSAQGGNVALEAEGFREAGREWVRCRVLDDGKGLRPEDLPRVFDPFFTKRKGGTGLGLSIAHRIVADHGGRIGAANRPSGGAELVVELPCGETQGNS